MQFVAEGAGYFILVEVLTCDLQRAKIHTFILVIAIVTCVGDVVNSICTACFLTHCFYYLFSSEGLKHIVLAAELVSTFA